MNYLNVLIIPFSDEYQILQILHGNDIINIFVENIKFILFCRRGRKE
jgi:hypothetical protein